MRTRASILVGLLWCVALLSLVVVSLLHTARMDLTVTKNHGDKIQAHYLALAGIEKAKALLFQEARDRSRSAKNHSGELYDSPDQFRDVALGRGYFRVVRRARSDEGGGLKFGVTDEEGRLNVNVAKADELTKLEGLTPDVAAAIIAWRGGGDGNNALTAAANAEYYLSLQPPYQPRNGPFQTVRELLLVRGVPSELLLGTDVRQNGQIENAESDGNSPFGDDLATGPVNSGWAGFMTVDSMPRNVSAAGQQRVNVQSADEAALTRVNGLNASIAKAIVQHRGQNPFKSLADLLDVSLQQNQAGGPGNPGANQPTQPTGGNSGQKVIDENLLMDIADDLTTDANPDQPGLVNINSASREVLACLPGVDRELAQAIISYRQSAGFFPNIAWLLKVSGMNQQTFKQIAPRVCVRSDTFRIFSEGKIKSTGARQRIEMIVHVGQSDIKTLSYRETDL